MASNLELLKRLKKIECQDSTGPAITHPLVFDRAEGSRIRDAEGREYLDLCGGFGVTALGHNPPEIRRLLSTYVQTGLDQSSQPQMPPILHGMGDVYPSRTKVEFVENLLAVLPLHFTRVSVALTGAQAVEIALKTAMLATKKTAFLCFHGSYHGVDLGVLPVTSRADFKEPFANWLGQNQVESVPYGCDKALIRSALMRLQKNHDGVAGIIVEPVQGRAGTIFPPAQWLGELRRFADEFRAALIFDEVFTGMGRLGRWTTAEIVPCDLVCFGKALGGGFPLSACVGTEKFMSAWPESAGEAIHTGTFFGHPLSCAAGATTIQAMKNRSIIASVADRGPKFLNHLRTTLSTLPGVKDIRGDGFMFAIECTSTGYGARLMDDLRARGVIALVSGERGHVLALTPAFTITDQEFSAGVGAIKESIIKLFS